MKRAVSTVLPVFLLSFFVLIISGCRGMGSAPAETSKPATSNQTPPPPAPTATLTVTPSSITAGDTTPITLTWSAQGATSVTIDNGIGVVSHSPITIPAPTVTTTYTLTATNDAGTPATAQAKLTVNPIQQTPGAPAVSFTASPTMITSGAQTPVTLTWNTQGATTVTLDSASVSNSGTMSVSPSDTTTYTLTATNSTGTPTVAKVTVTVSQSGIQHLVVVMMQNSSFDHLFGTYPNANGLDPTLPSYTQVDQAGNTVTPQLMTNFSPPDVNHLRSQYIAAWDNGAMDKYAYTNGDMSMDYYDSTSNVVLNGKLYGVGTLWGYANNYALADNFFASAMGSEPANILYMVSATVGHGINNGFGLPQLDTCAEQDKAKNSTASITPPLTFPSVGDQLSAKGIGWLWYHEGFSSEQSGACTNYVPQENVFQYFQSTANTPHILNYTNADFQKVLDAGTLPAVTWVQPAPTHDMHPGSGNIGNSVLWLDNFINAVKNSSAWPSTAIIVLFDESGGWYDHVAPPQIDSLGLGARVPVLVISPFAKANYISHDRMDFVSLLRFIQANWKLGVFTDQPEQAAREAQSGDICDLLTTTCSQP